MRKCKLLLFKINACLQKATACIGLEAEQIFSVNIYMGPLPFFILSGAFTVPFLFCIQKLHLLDVKKFWTNFCCIYVLFMTSENVYQILKILFQTGYVNIFVLHGVFFSRYVKPKNFLFWWKKHQWWNLRHTLLEKLCGKVLKENSIIGRSWSSAKLFIVQNYTENANGYVPLTVENVWHFNFFEFKVRTCSFFVKYIFILWC